MGYSKKEVMQMAENKIFAKMHMAQIKRRSAEIETPISFGDKRDQETALRHQIDQAERELLIYDYLYDLIQKDAT
jgi:hypothetical protein